MRPTMTMALSLEARVLGALLNQASGRTLRELSKSLHYPTRQIYDALTLLSGYGFVTHRKAGRAVRWTVVE